MLLPEFCKSDAMEVYKDARLMIEDPGFRIPAEHTATITRLLWFLESAALHCPLFPPRRKEERANGSNN